MGININTLLTRDNLLFLLVAVNEFISHLAILFLWRYPNLLTIIITILLIIQLWADSTISKLYIIIVFLIPLIYQPIHIYLSNIFTGGNGWTWCAPNFLNSITWASPLFGLGAIALIYLNRFVQKYID